MSERRHRELQRILQTIYRERGRDGTIRVLIDAVQRMADTHPPGSPERAELEASVVILRRMLT